MNESALRRLLYRWLVEFNPLYLLSAALVLGGASLMSRGLAQQGSLFGQLGVGAVAELYSAALIGGAALLTRIGLKRPAVMLALLTVLYQGDLTLHTETCVYLGWQGTLASIGWIALFVAKLVALGWAVRVRIPRSVIAVATFGACGVAGLPPNLVHLDARHGTGLVALWAFGLVAAALHVWRDVTSQVDLDAWGRTVLRRSVRASWAMWGALALFHVVFWSAQYGLELVVLAPLCLLLAARVMRSELRAWTTVVGTLSAVAAMLPELFSVTAFMAAGALLLRALFPMPTVSTVTAAREALGPYRTSTAEPHSVTFMSVGTICREACLRWLVGALASAYLGTWTLRWTGGPWPAHWIALDLALTALLVFAARRERSWPMLLPLSAVYGHVAVQSGLVSAPRTALQWGIASVGVGFALLSASLGASVRLKDVASDQSPRHALR